MILLSWYNLWDNWLNTTIRVLKSDCNENNVGFYFFKANAYRNKSKYLFGRNEHYEHKMLWTRKHRGKRNLYSNYKYRGKCNNMNRIW